MEDDKIILTAGFVAAITSFSKEIAQEENFYAIHSSGLYYAIIKIHDKIYTLQSMHHSKNLETQFLNICKKIDDVVRNVDDRMKIDTQQITTMLGGLPSA